MSRRTNKILVKDTLFVDIYLIGYRTKGESIIFIIYKDEKVDYVGVIDSYEVDNINLTMEILTKLGIEKIDFLCWTHPDEDHSIGIDKLLKLVDKNSKIFIPFGIERIKTQLNERISLTINEINKIASTRQNYSVIPISHGQDLDSKIYEFFNIKSINYNLKIKSLSPHSSIITKRGISIANKIKLNDYSISFYMELGQFTFLFAGDVENQTFKIIDVDVMDLPDSFDYVKIPHHASDSAENIFNTIFTESTQNEIACTTTFNSGSTRLPDKRIIDLYKECSAKVYCTDNNMEFIKIKQDYTSDGNGELLTTLDLNEKGIIHCRFDILNDSIETGTKLFGNAIEI